MRLDQAFCNLDGVAIPRRMRDTWTHGVGITVWGEFVDRLGRWPAFAEGAVSEAGRNDPCPCGSGKKYKRCCWASGGVGVRYTRQDRELALAALEEFVDGPAWQEIVEDAEDEFWLDVDPEATAVVSSASRLSCIDE